MEMWEQRFILILAIFFLRAFLAKETLAEWILARKFDARWKFCTAATCWL